MIAVCQCLWSTGSEFIPDVYGLQDAKLYHTSADVYGPQKVKLYHTSADTYGPQNVKLYHTSADGNNI